MLLWGPEQDREPGEAAGRTWYAESRVQLTSVPLPPKQGTRGTQLAENIKDVTNLALALTY